MRGRDLGTDRRSDIQMYHDGRGTTFRCVRMLWETGEAYGVLGKSVLKNTYNPLNDIIPSSRTLKYKNLLGGILCPEKVELMRQKR